MLIAQEPQESGECVFSFETKCLMSLLGVVVKDGCERNGSSDSGNTGSSPFPTGLFSCALDTSIPGPLRRQGPN